MNIKRVFQSASFALAVAVPPIGVSSTGVHEVVECICAGQQDACGQDQVADGIGGGKCKTCAQERVAVDTGAGRCKTCGKRDKRAIAKS